ncbi:acyl carrier protein-like protein [Zychaea mexicana]|uniref:acyl carrier protein-like protein n=1 Tax=Zychaea mexicana TaxID=64656 RepID=UPI0022FEA924|nr:acyl carrier protein-like protein [Zychaea mexicana]KAI9493219.1 acyl carrier protein-like protein [Zychaea mexicana]
MFRPTVLFNAASRVAAVRAPVSRFAAPAAFTRLYSAGAGTANIESRVLDILRGFDKVDQSKVSLDAHFVNDLGLDSLDTVEVVMAVEEEFSVEITDKDADEIKTAKQAIEYISKRADAH